MYYMGLGEEKIDVVAQKVCSDRFKSCSGSPPCTCDKCRTEKSLAFKCCQAFSSATHPLNRKKCMEGVDAALASCLKTCTGRFQSKAGTAIAVAGIAAGLWALSRSV